ncbi:metallopeptidase family protein [Candidatus Saccharibacteria bacterium]|nr:metallopeptidase family protein [Candidatus Saccharibacteria bacterium]
MLSISDSEFDAIISRAMDELPEEYIARLNNVVVVYEDNPSSQQREKLRLRCDQLLFGLYEGIPLTKRGAGYNLVLPDKITIFKDPILAYSHDLASFKEQVKRTLWHEIAHFYGLDHERIHGLENKPSGRNT